MQGELFPRRQPQNGREQKRARINHLLSPPVWIRVHYNQELFLPLMTDGNVISLVGEDDRLANFAPPVKGLCLPETTRGPSKLRQSSQLYQCGKDRSWNPCVSFCLQKGDCQRHQQRPKGPLAAHCGVIGISPSRNPLGPEQNCDQWVHMQARQVKTTFYVNVIE